MIFEIDAGNSRLKWRTVSAEGEVEEAGVVAGPMECLAGISRLKDISRVRIGSVRSRDYNAALSDNILTWFGVVPEFARSLECCGGVRNAYLHPEALGIDRWLGILAARRRSNGNSFLVIDAGSAVTLDFVDEAGEHLGGYIVPGLRMQVESLMRGTSMLVRKEELWGKVAPGRDTEHAICSGILSMMCQWIAAEVAAKRIDSSFRVLVTGGDAPLLSENLHSLGVCHETVPELVLDGLRVALP